MRLFFKTLFLVIFLRFCLVAVFVVNKNTWSAFCILFSCTFLQLLLFTRRKRYKYITYILMEFQAKSTLFKTSFHVPKTQKYIFCYKFEVSKILEMWRIFMIF